MKWSVHVAFPASLWMFVRFEKMIWLSIRFDIQNFNSLRHFLTANGKKKFWRMFSYPVGCKKKALSNILALRTPSNLPNTKVFIHDSGFSGTLHSQYFSLWIKFVVFINVLLNYSFCLDCLSRSLSYHCASCFQSYIWTSHVGVLKMPCVSHEMLLTSHLILPEGAMSHTWPEITSSPTIWGKSHNL